MVAADFSWPILAELGQRFLPQEAPVFEILREDGKVRLWKTTTAPHRLYSRHVGSQVHYHVTRGEEAEYMLMRDLGSAVEVFNHVAEVSHD